MPQEYDPTVWSRYAGDPERPRRRTVYDPSTWSRYATGAGSVADVSAPERTPPAAGERSESLLGRALGAVRDYIAQERAKGEALRQRAAERPPFDVRAVQRELAELGRRFPGPGMVGVGRGFETTPIEEVLPEERNILQDFVAGLESGRRATLRGVGTTLESLGLERVGRALREGEEPLPTLRPRERTGNRFVDVLRETAFDVGSGVATTVPTIVGGAIGTAVGGPVGGAVGALAPAAGLTYGGLREELEGEGVDPQTASRAAAVVTPLSAALEALVPLSIGRRLLGEAGQQAARGVAREIARSALREGVTEAATEAAQTALERGAVAATTPQKFLSRETLDEIIRAARAGGLTGGLLGGASTAVGAIGPSVPAVDAYLAELGRLQEKYGAELEGITPREAQGLERLARRVAEEAGLGEEVLEPIRAEERPTREARFSRFRRRIAEAISPELRREATEDPLTGLANRGADARATSEALRERAPGTRTVRFRVDLDNFKALNDTMGHAAGDEALRVVADALRRALREGDVITVARPGGDEFAITLRVAEGTDPAVVRDRLEEAVNRALEEAGLARAGDRTVSASIGFAEARPGMSAEELDRLADQAAIARKAERGVSRPREEAAPAPAEPSGAPGVRMDEEASASADMDAVVEEATEGMEEPATAAEPIDVERVPTVEPERARPQNAGDVGLFPISEIRVDPKRFQFKMDTDPETGAGAELKSVRKFDPVLAGVIQVWRDPADGQVYVVNGHHRLELARRLGEKEILVRFIDARDAGEARLIGAMTNIAEGRGTAIDAAKIFREQRITPEQLERRGISLRGAIARDGLALANLPQKLFDDVVARRISIPRAAIIGGSGLSEDQQLALAKLLEQRKNITNEEAAELVRFVKSAGETEVETIDLFGPQVLRQSLALEKAELSAYVKKQLAQDRRLFGYVGRGRRAQQIEGRGAGRIDVGRAQQIAQQAAQAEEVYNRLSTMAGPISDALNAAAARLAAGEKADVVKRELYDQVRDAIAAELQAFQRRPAAPAVRERPLQPDLFGEEPQAELVQGELFAEVPSFESPRLSEAEQGARQIVSLLEGKVRRGAASKTEVERYEAARKLLARSQKISAEEMAAEARRAGRVQPADRDTGDLFAAPPEARQPEPTETESPRIGQRTEPEEAPAAAPATPAADLPIRVSPDDIPYQVAYDAYRWNSFTPERRARQTQEEYVRHIEAVYEDLAPLARTEEQRRVLIDELERYRRGYVERELELLRATSRTASPMVTGPARFPVDRNRKALERVARLTREFIQWRDRAIEAMRRKIERAGQEDIDPIEAARRELAEAEALQEHMKRANAIMRRSGLSDEQKRQAMREAGIPDDLIQEAFTPDPVMGALGFGRYRLGNYNLETNNARIRRLRQRIEELERRATRTTREIRFDGGRIVENAEADRLQIFFDSVPSQEIRNQLKSRGFRWSPREGAWQRQLTNQARWAASSILGVDIPAQDRPRIGERRTTWAAELVPGLPADIDIASPTVRELIASGRWNLTAEEVTGRFLSPGERFEIRISPRLPEGIEEIPATRPGGLRRWYDPQLAEVTDDGQIRLRADSGLSQRIPAEAEAGFIYRGMSAEELAEALERGYLQSRGEYNLVGQEGFTFFAEDPRVAASYATGFQPYPWIPTFGRPGFVVKIGRPDNAISGTATVLDGEVAVPGRIDVSEIEAIYEAVPYAVAEGVVEINRDAVTNQYVERSRSSPDAYVAWRTTTVAEARRALRGLARPRIGERVVRETSPVYGVEDRGLEGTKVVDENGEPKVVFHGTMAAFEEFEENLLSPQGLFGPGFYFTEDPEVASGYARTKPPQRTRPLTRIEELREYFRPGRIVPSFGGRRDRVLEFHETGAGGWYVVVQEVDAEGNPIGPPRSHFTTPEVPIEVAPNVRPARLRITNPFDIDRVYRVGDLPEPLRSVVITYAQRLGELGVVVDERLLDVRLHGGEVYSALEHAGGDKAGARRILEQAGYDGITHIGGRRVGDREHRVWIAFRRDQIRSAFGPATTAPQVGEARPTYAADITQTPAFRRWFGNSKVVDDRGQPLVVYHGTKGDFEAFDPEFLGTTTGARTAREGFFFTDNPLVASAYAERMPRPDDVRRLREIEQRTQEIRNRRYEIFDELDRLRETAPQGQEPEGWRERVAELDALNEEERALDREYMELRRGTRMMSQAARQRPGANVMPVYLSIQNPFVVDMGGRDYDGDAVLEAIRRAKAEGHDGVLVRNVYDAPVMYGGQAFFSNIWIAFRPEQVKSAIGNRGTFDPTDPSILRESAPLYGGDVIRQHGAFTNPAPVDWNQPDNYYGVWTADRVRLFTGAGPDAPVYRAIIPADELTPSLVEAEDAAAIRGGTEAIDDVYYDRAREILERHARSRFRDPQLDEWRDFLPIGRDYDEQDVELLAREMAARDMEADPVEEEFRTSTTNPPPVVVRKRADGSYDILDGNHRIALWQELGYDGIPAWVIEDPTRGAVHETAARYEPLGALEGTKVVDENGEPKAVFHGTRFAFESFDERLADPHALYGPGFYFTEDPEVAGGVIEPEVEIRTFRTEEEAERAPGRRGFVWSHWPDEWYAQIVVGARTVRPGYAFKLPNVLIVEDPAIRRRIVQEIERNEGWKLTDPGYLSQTEREAMRRYLDQFEKDGDVAMLIDLLERQPFNVRVLDYAARTGALGQPNVRPARLAIRNPFDINALVTIEDGRVAGETARLVDLARREYPDFDWDHLVEQVERMAVHGNPDNEMLYNAIRHVRNDRGQRFGKVRLAELLQRAGYDGITYIGGRIRGNREHRVWIAFRRDQIRSAFGPANRASVVGERRNRSGLEDQLTLDFGSVDEAKRVVRDIAEEAGPLLQISIPGVPLTRERIEAVRRGREAAKAWATATGHKLQTRDGHLDYENMFRLLRTYRHPAAEYWHILVLVPSGDGQLEVAHHRLSSAGALDSTFVFAGDIVEAAAIAQRRGGQVVFAHNHPSGDPRPSPEDRDVTITAAEIIRKIGAEFGGHFVINHETATIIESDFSQREIRVPADPDSFDWNLHDRRKRITGPDSVADYLSGFPVDQSRVDVLVLNTQHQIVAFEARPIGDLDTLGEWLPALQRDAAALSIVIGTGGQQAYERAIRAVNAISGVGVLDVVNAPTRESAVMQRRLEKARLDTAPAMVPIFERRAAYGEGAEGDTPAVPGRPGEPPGVRPGRFARRVREGVPGAEAEGGRAGEGEGEVGPAVARGRLAAEEVRQLRAAAAYAPIVRIRGDEFGTFTFNPVDIQHARDRARDYLRTHVVGTSVVNEATGDTIHFNLVGIKKTLSHAANADHVRSLIALPELMRNAVHVKREPNRNPAQAQMVPWVHTYAARLQIGDRVMTVRLTVKEARDGRRFYDHELLERLEPGGRIRTSSLDKPEDALTQPPGSIRTVQPSEGEVKPGEGRGRPRIGERRPLYLRAPAPPEPAESRTPLLSGWAELKAQALAEGQLPPRIRGFASERLPDAGPIVVGTAETAPRPSDIQRRIQEGLEIKIGIGRFGSGRFMRSVLGLYKPGPRSIRLARYGDIATLGHELGHDMHSLFFGQVQGHLTDDHFVFQPWRDELEQLAVGISDESLAEGWAEFWRRYIDNPDVLPERAPKLLAYVEDRLERDYPALKTLFEQAQRDWRVYREASPQARIRAQISTGEEERNLGIRDRWRRFRTAIIDDIEPIRHVVEKLTGTDRPQDIEEDAATLARLVRGSMGTAEVFLEHGVLDFRTLRKVGPSLREVFEPVLDDLGDFRDYMVARRAQELHARDITTGIRPDDADWVVRELEKGERGERFKRTFDRLQEYNRGLLKYLVDAGVMSRETMQKILETNQNYVPFYRVIDDQPQKGNARFSLGFGHLFSPVKRIKGSGRDIIDPIESLIKNTYLYVHIAARQQVSNALARLAERHGAARFIERIPAPMVPHRFRLGEIETQLEKIIGKEPLAELRAEARKRFEQETAGMQPGEIKEAGLQPYDPADEILMFFRPGDYFGKPNIISVLQDGKRVWYEVDPELYAALEGLHPKSVDAFVRLLSAPARTLRAGAILAPEFLIRNPARDQLMAFVQSEYGYNPGVDFVRGLFSLLRKDDYYWRWKAAGGENAALVAMDRKAMRQNVERLLREGGVRNVLKSPLDVLRAISETMENATRLGEFRRAVRAEGDTKAGLLRAASASREVTTDFARHGAQTVALALIAAFWNPRVQGYDRLARAIKRNPVRTFARIGAGITLPSIILYAINRDDPDYWELPLWMRDLFWHAKIDGTWVRIPKPFELGVAFGTIPERILEWIESNDPEGLRESLEDFLVGEIGGTVLPSVTAFLPLFENLANYSLFFRRPIVPRSMQDVEPRFQATERTSEIAKLLGRWTNVSPMKIDHLLFSWTGGLGRLASQAVDVAVDLARDPERALDEISAARPEDVPGVRGVVSRAPGFSSESVERFYRRLQEARSVRATANHLEREERFDEADAFLANPRRQELLAQLRHLERVADRLAQLRAQAAIIERDPNMPAAQKKEEVDRLGREAMELARAAIERRTPAEAGTR